MIPRTIRSIQLFLGPARLRALFLLLAGTGIVSLVLNAVEADWVRPVQTLLAIAFFIGAAIIIGGRLDTDERNRWLAILGPALLSILLGVFFVPDLRAPLAGVGLGWIAAGLFLTRSRMPMQYREAIKHLRKNEYDEAVKVMDRVIKTEPKQPNHYRFRAEMLRVWGRLDRARRDYEKMTSLAPNSAVAYNGLAEVYLQMGNFAQAREAAQRAHELAPDDWVTSYNLGMIEDRLQQSEQVIDHLQTALALIVPDARHRLLIHLYLARAYSRLGNGEAAQSEVNTIQRHRAGLEEWRTILDSDQAATLRAVLGADIQAAHDLADGKLDVAALAHG
jgi:tetratricopeptide (TPR) repeat protein